MSAYTDTLVDVEELRDLARCGYRLCVKNSEATQNAIAMAAGPAPDGTPIFDVEGRLLFFDYVTLADSGAESRVRVAASEALGIPIISRTERTEPTPLDQWIASAKGLLDGKPGTDTLVCHAYPRLGLLRTDGETRWLVDFAGGAPLDVSPGSLGEMSTWSLYDLVAEDQVAGNVARWEVLASRIRADDQVMGGLVKERAELTVPLKAQDCEQCCVPAVAAMILGFHQVPNTDEDTMRGRMETDPVLTGTTPANEEKGYRVAAPEYILLRDNPDWEKAKQEIKNKLPFKVGLNVKGALHARAVRGYVEYDSGQQWLIVNDPLLGGSVTYEAWSEMLHTGFLFVRPPNPAHNDAEPLAAQSAAAVAAGAIPAPATFPPPSHDIISAQ